MQPMYNALANCTVAFQFRTGACRVAKPWLVQQECRMTTTTYYDEPMLQTRLQTTPSRKTMQFTLRRLEWAWQAPLWLKTGGQQGGGMPPICCCMAICCIIAILRKASAESFLLQALHTSTPTAMRSLNSSWTGSGVGGWSPKSLLQLLHLLHLLR